jgi:hypothetical protein
LVDFRYHALSLVAVFLALGIGVVLGVTVGDSLVSDADRNLRESLRDDVTEAREEAERERDLGARRDEVIDQAVPEAARGRLAGRRFALISFDELPGSVSEAVEQGIGEGGGRLVRTAVLSSEDRRELGPPRNLGRLIENGGPAARRLREALPRLFNGRYRDPVDALVIYRHPPPEDDEDAERRERFESAVMRRLRDNVVAVEQRDTDPSQVGWYEDQSVASVDNVDVPAGQLALVLLLEDAAVAEATSERPEGSYGYKDTADRALPDLSE